MKVFVSQRGTKSCKSLNLKTSNTSFDFAHFSNFIFENVTFTSALWCFGMSLDDAQTWLGKIQFKVSK